MTGFLVWRVLWSLTSLFGMTVLVRADPPKDGKALAEEFGALATREASAYAASIGIALGLSAQGPAAKETARNTGAERLEFMKESARSYTLKIERDQNTVLKLQPDPVFRLGNQGDGMVLEGAIFLWADEVGRPGAAAQVFLIKITGPPDSEWRHEFTALSTGTLSATQGDQPRWQPRVPGVQFQPIPGARSRPINPSSG